MHQSLEERQVAAIEHLAHEACAIQDTLEVLVRHLLGGMSPEEVAAAKAEAMALREKLKTSRKTLLAAIAAASPKDPK